MYVFERIKNKISSKGVLIIRLHSRYTARQRTLRVWPCINNLSIP